MFWRAVKEGYVSEDDRFIIQYNESCDMWMLKDSHLNITKMYQFPKLAMTAAEYEKEFSQA